MAAELDVIRELLAAAPLFGDPSEALDVAALRKGIDALSGSLPLPAGLTREEVLLGGRPADLLAPADPRPGAVLYLHGGGYVIGSRVSHGGIGGALAAALDRPVALLDYRLAPEAPFPAALDDAVSAFEALAREHGPERVAIAGDSAGGGLTLATLLRVRDGGAPLPATAVALSPWTDLRCDSDSMRTRIDVDPMCHPAGLRRMAAAYLGDAAATDPLASPVLADLRGLPPLLIQVGDAEVLLDDSVELARRASEAGVDVELEVWDEMIHVFQCFVGLLPDAQRAIDRIADHVDRHLA